MTGSTVNFTLSADVPDSELVLFSSLTGSTSLMVYSGPGSDAHTHFYTTTLDLPDIPSFPFTVDYRYTKDGADCFPGCGRFIIARSSPSPISIRDSLASEQYTDHTVFSVTFHIPDTFQPGRPPALLLQDHSDPIPMTHDPEHNLYRHTHTFSIFTVQPLFYHYAILDSPLKSELGRPHNLFIRFPVGGFHISVYELFHESIPSFSYTSRPICPTFSSETVPFSIEAVSPFQPTDCYFRRFDSPDDLPLEPAGAWILVQDVSLSKLDFQFALEWQPESDIESEVCPFTSFEKSDAILYRSIRDSPISRGLSVFLPLVSLRPNSAKTVGDFSVIPGLATWAKSVGISVIHLHVEQLSGNLIDPVIADIPVEGNAANLVEVREAKVAALWLLFRESVESTKDYVTEFRVRHAWINEACRSEFAVWVQWFLAAQLTAAFERVAELGVQIMVDAVLFNVGSLVEKMNWFAHFAQAVRIVGIEQAPVEYPALQRAQETLGQWTESVAGFVSQTLPQWRLGRVQNWLERGMSFVNQTVQVPLTWVDEIPRPGLHRAMAGLAGQCPAAVVLSAAAQRRFTANEIAAFHCLPENSEVIGSLSGNQVLCAAYLSPEVVSEFPVEVSLEEMRAEIVRKCQTEAVLVDLFFGDLVSVARGERVDVDAVQVVEHQRRFVFRFTLEELLQEPELRGGVREVLQEGRRSG
jgi:hypothetical protein